MTDMADPVLRTHIGGELVEFPGSLAGIRAGLPDEETREAFDREIARAPLEHVALIAAEWGLPQEARDEDDCPVSLNRVVSQRSESFGLLSQGT